MANITVPKNTERWLFIDVTPSEEIETFARIGKGVTAATPSNSPTVNSQHYIDAAAPTHSVTALEKTFSLTMERYVGDAANDYLAGLDDKTGDDVKSHIVMVDLTEDAASGNANAYPAKKYEVVVGLDQPYSVEGGASQAMTCTIYTNGDPEEGWFDTDAATWSVTEPEGDGEDGEDGDSGTDGEGGEGEDEPLTNEEVEEAAEDYFENLSASKMIGDLKSMLDSYPSASVDGMSWVMNAYNTTSSQCLFQVSDYAFDADGTRKISGLLNFYFTGTTENERFLATGWNLVSANCTLTGGISEVDDISMEITGEFTRALSCTYSGGNLTGVDDDLDGLDFGTPTSGSITYNNVEYTVEDIFG